jgi:membrane protein required for colicin V production
MNYLDFIILAPLIYAAWKGFKKGLIVEVFTLLALLVGIYAGIHFSDWTATKIEDLFEKDFQYLPAIAFTITFLAVGAMVYFAGKTLEKMVSVVNLSPLNKGLGILFGLIKMLYTISILFILLESYDPNDKFIPLDTKETSMLYKPVRNTSVYTMPFIEETQLYFNKWQGDSLTIEDGLDINNKLDSLDVR